MASLIFLAHQYLYALEITIIFKKKLKNIALIMLETNLSICSILPMHISSETFTKALRVRCSGLEVVLSGGSRIFISIYVYGYFFETETEV